MPTVDVPLGEWLPTAPTHSLPGCVVAENVIPARGGYRPFRSAVATTKTAAQTSRGAQSFWSVEGDAYVASGGSTTLSLIRPGAVVNKTGLDDIGSGFWDFAQFNDILIATNATAGTWEVININLSTGWSPLRGSPPAANYCARVEDFLMLGGIAGNLNRIQWSSFNAPSAVWAPNRLTQAGFADLPREFGQVQRIIGGRYPLVFQERGISRIEYIGPPVVWRAVEIEQGRGLVAPFSTAQVGFITYFLAQDGFFATNGSENQPIGSQRVNEWFFREVSAARMHETHAAISWQDECVMWAFKSPDSTVFDRLLIYSWAENRWSTASLPIDRLVAFKSDGLTLEQIGEIYPSMEGVPSSLDSEQWAGKSRVLSAFVGDALQTLNGVTLPARIETGEFQPQPGRRVFVTGGRALGDGSELWRMGVSGRSNARIETVSLPTSPGLDGNCPQRVDAQTASLVLEANIGADWRNIQGAQVTFKTSGAR